MSKNIKTLLFEGAGSRTEETGDVGNCRIRTAFINNDKQKIYLEIMQSARNNTCIVDFCHYITEDPKIDDCNQSTLPFERKINNVNYDKKSIVEMINKNCNCTFEDMEVLDDMEGYRVHADNRGYNFMDDHIINRERTVAREKAYKEAEVYYNEKLGTKYPPIGMFSMDDNSITIRCHTYEKDLYKVNMTQENRLQVIPVKY